jgi:purine-binding chemotaxis protein CheW
MEQTGNQSQFLVFHLAGEEYAISILSVKEIMGYEIVTRVPNTPPFIRGVINLRGSVVPVIDLAARLGLPETPLTNRTCIVIAELELEAEKLPMGLICDDVSEVLDLLPGDIESPPAFGMPIKLDYLLGLGKVGKKFVLLLNIERVLSTGELTYVTRATRQEEADWKLVAS